MDNLTKFWINNKQLWFNSIPETDQIVVSEVEKLNINIDTLPIIGQIIYHDQIIRHYARHFNTLDIILEHNKIAISLTKNNLDNYNITIPGLSSIEICFAIMPLRHSIDETVRILAIKIIESYLDKEPKNGDYMRFYQASLERVRDPKLYISSNPFPQYLVCSSSTFNILDTQYEKFTLEDISSEYITGFKQAIPNNKEEITVSISGGSDSMLCLFIAYKMGYKVKAMMIDYCNRNEHQDELYFVSWFCQKLGVEYYVREIKELKRERDSTREFYESVTKNIRFRSYKFMNTPVILGHNLDDCFENCITNIMTQRSKDNLYGMKPMSELMGVSLRRPVLSIPKSSIVEMCNKFNIPFLLDSTPKWSRRGKIRDIIVPALKQFDDNLIPRMMEFCQESSQSLQDYQALLENYPIQVLNKQYILDLTNQFNTNVRFWQGIINRITGMANINKIRISTIESMIKSIEKELNNQHNKNEIKVSLSVELKAFINVPRTSISFKIMF